MELLEKFKDLLMPEYIEEEEIEEEETAAAVTAPVRAPIKRVVNGNPAPVFPVPPVASSTRPKLTVHTSETAELAVDIHIPSAFDQVRRIADDLLARKAAIVNYERVDSNEGRRISDFLNGVCYMLDGEARLISDNMALYVPKGINITSVTPKAKTAKA